MLLVITLLGEYLTRDAVCLILLPYHHNWCRAEVHFILKYYTTMQGIGCVLIHWVISDYTVLDLQYAAAIKMYVFCWMNIKIFYFKVLHYLKTTTIFEVDN